MKRKNSQAKLEEELELPKAQSEPEKVSFFSWFQSKLQEIPRLQAWQRSPLLVFMKEKGLSENEEKEKYDKAYERF